MGHLRHLRSLGLPLAQQLVQTILHADLRRGGAGTVEPSLTALLGHPARTVKDYIIDHSQLWREPW